MLKKIKSIIGKKPKNEKVDSNQIIVDDEINNKYKKYATEKIKKIYSDDILGIEHFNEDIAIKLLELNQGFNEELDLKKLKEFKSQLSDVVSEIDKDSFSMNDGYMEKSDEKQIMDFTSWYENFIKSEQGKDNTTGNNDEVKDKYNEYASEKIKESYSKEISGVEYLDKNIALKLLELNQAFNSTLNLEQLKTLKNQLGNIVNEVEKHNHMIKKKDLGGSPEEKKAFKNINYNKEVLNFQGWFENTGTQSKEKEIDIAFAKGTQRDTNEVRRDYTKYVEKKVKKIYSTEIQGIENLGSKEILTIHELNQRYNRNLINTRSNENIKNKKSTQPLSLDEIKNIYNQIEEIIKEVDRCNAKHKENSQNKNQEPDKLQSNKNNNAKNNSNKNKKKKSKKKNQELER